MRRSKKTISNLELSVFIHATEDPQKVLKAVNFILPEEYVEDVKYEKTVLSGHYRNPIVVMKASIQDTRRVSTLLRRVIGTLQLDDLATLSADFKNYLDSKGNLYIRFDKQEAFLGKIKLCTIDPIRIKARINPNPKTFEELEIYLKRDG